MSKKQHIKLFSHNDLDGFGAPLLLQALQPQMFANVHFDLTTCSAGNLDETLAEWFSSAEPSQYDAVFIMDLTPNSNYSMQQLDSTFANHWLIFDHHESEESLRSQYSANCPTASDTTQNPSATSLVWDWVQQHHDFAKVDEAIKNRLADIVELIRAYDTWDFQNDPTMDPKEVKAADELNQLFWFYPLSQSQRFVTSVYELGWDEFATQNELLITTLANRRERYLHKHLKDVVEFELDGKALAMVYADDYKSEIAHAVLAQHNVLACLVVDAKNISLRSNGKLDVAQLAKRYFNGGGHPDSAGGSLTTNVIQAGQHILIDELTQQAAAKQAETNASDDNSLFDQLDEATAAKMKALFEK